ncbi:MAG: Hsp20/alpha crystallin family protein [Thermoprotei archaeon]|nr:MAG: Hsp20/alpha crystallin family protein [Thermoprotei archaeon]
MSIDEFFERIRRRMRELFEEFEREARYLADMWSPTGTLRPLYSVNEYPDHVEILVDLPYSNLDTLSVETRNGKLVIGCSLRGEVEFDSWFKGRGVKFNKYYIEIELPPDADPAGLRIEKNIPHGVVKIVLRRKRATTP